MTQEVMKLLDELAKRYGSTAQELVTQIGLERRFTWVLEITIAGTLIALSIMAFVICLYTAKRKIKEKYTSLDIWDFDRMYASIFIGGLICVICTPLLVDSLIKLYRWEYFPELMLTNYILGMIGG